MLDQADRFSLIEQVLEEDHLLVAGALPGFLPQREPRRWLYDLVAVYPSRRGKGLRPSLCLSAARAFGASSSEALPSAVAIELVHNAFLVHDDVEDGSEQRRGRPTLHHEAGEGLAINAGDALAVLAMAPLRQNSAVLGGRMSQRVADEFQTMMFRTIEGQAIELGWRRDTILDLEPDDYLNLVLLKTCAYTTIYPLRIGAIIGSWGGADLDDITRFGFYLGAAFQIQDDILNLVGSESAYGKERDGDLYEGKRTLMLIHVLNSASDTERDEISRFLAKDRHDRSADDVARIRDLMGMYRSVEYAREFAAGIADLARESFDAAFGGVKPGRDTEFLRETVDYMTARER